MAKKITPVSFDGWLGKVIDNESETHGGREAIAGWIGTSKQSVNRRARGEVPYLAREVEIIAEKIDVTTRELVEYALRKSGGIDKLIAEYGPTSEDAATVTTEDNITYLGHVTPPMDAAADENPRKE